MAQAEQYIWDNTLVLVLKIKIKGESFTKLYINHL